MIGTAAHQKPEIRGFGVRWFEGLNTAKRGTQLRPLSKEDGNEGFNSSKEGGCPTISLKRILKANYCFIWIFLDPMH